MSNWKEVTPRKIRTFMLGEKPELLHIVELGYDDLYAVFFEGAYEMEPWHTGLRVMTKAGIKSIYTIEL